MPRKGQKHSKETKARISVITKRHWVNPGYREKVVTALTGRKVVYAPRKVSARSLANLRTPPIRWGVKPSSETRMKMSLAHKGLKHTEQARKKIAAATKGTLNPNWNGGISRTGYNYKFNTELKADIRARDAHKCQLCGAPAAECNRALDVHHIDYDKHNNDPVNLIALCQGCNIRVNQNRAQWASFFGEIIKRKLVKTILGE